MGQVTPKTRHILLVGQKVRIWRLQQVATERVREVLCNVLPHIVCAYHVPEATERMPPQRPRARKGDCITEIRVLLEHLHQRRLVIPSLLGRQRSIRRQPLLQELVAPGLVFEQQKARGDKDMPPFFDADAI